MLEIQQKIFPQVKNTDVGFVDKVKDIKNRIVEIGNQVKSNTREYAIWAIKVVAGYLFDCVVFPFTIFLILLWLTRQGAAYAFEIKRSQFFKEDISDILLRKGREGKSGSQTGSGVNI